MANKIVELIERIEQNKSDFLFSLGINEFDHFVRGYSYAQFDLGNSVCDELMIFTNWLGRVEN